MSWGKWLMITGAGIALCVVAFVVGVAALFMLPGMFANPFLPIYRHDQTPSSHPGFLRTTATSGNTVYVNDYEEYSLQLIDREPKQIVGRTKLGTGDIRAIPGQKPSDYLAVDVGSEMPAYAVFRNIKTPPFDWRTVAYQSMMFSIPTGPASNKSTTDAARIADVLHTLKEGTPATPQPPPGTMSNVFAVYLSSDQLPGMMFAPSVYMHESGMVYLAENVAMEFVDRKTLFQGRWILASPEFTEWVKTP